MEATGIVGKRGATGSGLMVWEVGALTHAVAQTLDARFNPVAVRGEISGFSRATSGHCYFSLKDADGQIRCAMFRRAASMLNFNPRDGELVEVRGRLTVYEPRGDLQLVVEAMERSGQGSLFEQFLQRKAKLEAEGLFAQQRKRPVPQAPRCIGVVTSLGAAALQDVLTALQRRVPHIPVVLAPAAVQGAGAAAELVAALSKLYQTIHTGYGFEGKNTANFEATPVPDVILLVRGGGSLEDLWSFNDEALARAIAKSPVPVICGVGHETDFTIADWVADLRAPTPTAAAELAAVPRADWLGAADVLQAQLERSVVRRLEQLQQRLDQVSARLSRPSQLLAQQQHTLVALAHRLHHATHSSLARRSASLEPLGHALLRALRSASEAQAQRLQRAALRLQLLDPALVLRRGYAWLQDGQGTAITQAAQAHQGQQLQAVLADGQLDLQVQGKALH